MLVNIYDEVGVRARLLGGGFAARQSGSAKRDSGSGKEFTAGTRLWGVVIHVGQNLGGVSAEFKSESKTAEGSRTP